MHNLLAHLCSVNRRAFLRDAGIALVGLAAPSRLLATGDAPLQKWTPLGLLAAKKNIAFGFALNAHLLAANADYSALVARECTIVVPENALKWGAVHPAPGEYTFDQADAIVHFAEAHNMKVRGHNFCWHRALPAWVTQNVNEENAEQILREHIATVAGRYRGKVQSWDVVNEAIQLRDNMPNGFRNSFWYSTLGTAYMDIAFDAARHADPNAILTYNDFGLEYENKADNAKRKAVLAMLRDLKKRGVPVQALGIQSHLRVGTGEDFGGDLTHFIAEVHDLGLKVYVTELDVDDSHLTAGGIARDVAIADVFGRYLDLVLSTGCISTVITWGAWDIAKPTGAENVSGLSAEKPLLFTRDSLPKLDALTVAKSIQGAPTQH